MTANVWIIQPGLAPLDFMTIRNNLFYVLIVVPTQTVLALVLALVVNQKVLRGRGFFRTAFFFPSVASSVAISVVFLFIFTNGGAFNAVLALLGIRGPQWFSDLAGSSTWPCRTPGWSRRRRRL
jgi:multiple sugar transport system permease protein